LRLSISWPRPRRTSGWGSSLTSTSKTDQGDAAEEGYQEVKRELTGLVKLAEKSEAVVNIEVSWTNVIGTIERAERLCREIPSPALKLTLDPANLNWSASGAFRATVISV
jgi:sugar phosphate isomerase/epimerase